MSLTYLTGLGSAGRPTSVTLGADLARRGPWLLVLSVFSLRSAIAQAIGSVLLQGTIPTVESVLRADLEAVAVGRGIVVAQQIVPYRRGSGPPPACLDVLEARVSSRNMQDPFTGRSLCYRTTRAGFVLYSTGADGRDDEGDPGRDLILERSAE